jgi:asparagine synthase (glutamine-hydrolysing)
MLAADTAVILPDDFLVKVDRASMAHGLEVRPPLLDHELLELTATIPSRWKVHNGSTKWLLKQACKEQLPKEVRSRPKHGFEIPLDEWLRGPLRDMFESCVIHSSGPLQQLIDSKQAQKLYHSHLTGIGTHGATLWALVVLARWSERYLRSAFRPLEQQSSSGAA